MTNPRDDGEAMNCCPYCGAEEPHHHGGRTDPEFIAMCGEAASTEAKLAEAQGVIERYGKALDEIGQMGPHTAAWSAQTVARVARNPSRSRTTEGK